MSTKTPLNRDNVIPKQLLHHDDDAIDPDGPNDIDVSRMVPNGTANNDYTIGENPEFQTQIRQLLHEYGDIFSYNVKGNPQ